MRSAPSERTGNDAWPDRVRPGAPLGTAERRRLELVHESLLTHWPRLVRWQAQDAEWAVLRDQLRQAAQLWERHGRAADFLWTGTAYREYQLWRERYTGGLTALEVAFADAMTALAHRRRRRRRTAIAAAFALLATGLVAVSALRQQSVAQAQRAERQTRRAESEARRAEASKLLALGQLELQSNHTAALAYAIKSLELDDSQAARMFALKALAAGPPGILHRGLRAGGPSQMYRVVFSPDGSWVAVLGPEKLQIVSREGGSGRFLAPLPSGTARFSVAFDRSGQHLYVARDSRVQVWAVPAFNLIETQRLRGPFTSVRTTGPTVMVTTRVTGAPHQLEIASLDVGAPPRPMGRIEGVGDWVIDNAARTLAFARKNVLYVRPLTEERAPPRQIGRYEGGVGVRFHPAGDRVAAYDDALKEIRLWSLTHRTETPTRLFASPFEPLSDFTFDAAGSRLAVAGTTAKGLRVELWALDSPLSAAARSFGAPFGGFLHDVSFTPDGKWLATANRHVVCFWPLARTEPRVLLGHGLGVTDVRFTPDGERLVSVDRGGEVREWSLAPGGASRVLARVNHWSVLDVDRRGRFIVVTQPLGAAIVPMDGGATRALKGFAPGVWIGAIAIDSEGRRVAAAGGSGEKKDKVIRVWDLETGEVRVLGPTEQAGEGAAGQVLGLGFLADGSVVSAGHGGLRRWSLASGAHEVVGPSFMQSHLSVFGSGRWVAYVVRGRRNARPGDVSQTQSLSVALTDLVTRKTRILGSHGGRVMSVGVDPSGAILVTGSHDGIVRVGLVNGSEPRLLMGHEGAIHTVDISPDGRWIASGGDDRMVRIWPMPDMSGPPLHTLPHDTLLAKLKSLTNVRVVDESSSTLSPWLRTDRGSGYELEIEPFPGWAKVPEW